MIEIWPKIYREILDLSTQVAQMKTPFLGSFSCGQEGDDVLVYSIFTICGWNRELHKDSVSGTLSSCCHLGPILNLYNYEHLIAENKAHVPGSNEVSREMKTNDIIPSIPFATNNWKPNGIDDSVH